MINTISDLLKKLMDEEARKLGEYSMGLHHAPTIGDMYEGLTKNILSKSIPEDLNLDIASGFIVNSSGQSSRQIDCMLVRGQGEQIPYTDSYKWDVKDVIAVFEVKKTLYSDELKDSYEKLRDVFDIHSDFIQKYRGDETINIDFVLETFASITGSMPPAHKDITILPFGTEMIYHSLIVEQVSPVRIMLGYDGFKSEHSFRQGLYDYLESNLMKKGFGVNSFPQLCISGNYSLVKLNGQPYRPPFDNDWWHFLGSSSANPIRFVLEFIWTRLSQIYEIGFWWDDETDVERITPCLKAKIHTSGTQIGWDYQFVTVSKQTLEDMPSTDPWEPRFVDLPMFTFFNVLCRKGEEQLDNPSFLQFISEQGLCKETFIKGVLSTGMVASSGNTIHLTTKLCRCVITPDGRFAVADDYTGIFTRWIANQTSSIR